MLAGHFYFVKDEFFKDFPDQNLMRNKETVNGVKHGRPAFYIYKDGVSGLDWVIPISSQVTKFRNIYSKKTQNGKRCDTIVFGNVLGIEKVFLIQNMHPVADRYIGDEYVDSNNVPVRVEHRLGAELNSKAKKSSRTLS